MKLFIIKCFANMLGFYMASLLFSVISIASLTAVFWAGLILGLITLLIRPLLLLISLPINLITMGMFTLVINTWLVQLTSFLTNGINIPSFWYALATALIIYLTNILASKLNSNFAG